MVGGLDEAAAELTAIGPDLGASPRVDQDIEDTSDTLVDLGVRKEELVRPLAVN